MQDRQDQSDQLAAQLAAASVAVALFSIAVGIWSVNGGVAVGFIIGAIALFAISCNFIKLTHFELQKPFTISVIPQRGYWKAFVLAVTGAILLSATVSTILGLVTYTFELKRNLQEEVSRHEIRHLNDGQKVRLRRDLELGSDEQFFFQINSMPSCDECEQFAEELREFFNSIPGWKTLGGPLIFPAPPRRGLWFIVNDADQHLKPVEKIFKAFEDAGISLKRSSDGTSTGTFVILVARPGT